ncbi:tRNA (guanine(10)-N2)-methyltransferase homolog [Xenopus laevis]|uniref:tRNA (guanine(10)-N(2))-methyltransferase TRMT11 n=2 Tax=Xenopus laevis TaxID=8355 RepID=TRM11_XENLA|nr:tRNA (guanine(10)-N2)-methyltransferase homolog [Xenopus laevis]Q6NS23.1 RecName: Full=tRNA (guanine(10)-N2)-methyltransferase homolog; AltName: Full=tRNA guanosine-2'-O-methyltransferase TRM11 homolog [Xenopus laevis]AAH70528.1 Trmt11 protein [Xenopus laevis]
MALPCKTGAAFKKYLLLLAQENCEFRLPEIKSLLSLYGGHFNNLQDEHGKSPFCILNLPSEEMARKLMKRTVCAKSVFELWGHGKTFMEFQQSVLSYPLENMMSYLQPNSTYKIIIHSFNKTLTQKEKLEKINTMEFIPFQGKVNLQNAENIFYLLEDYGSDPNKAPNEPFEIFFGRWIADGQRELINSYSVKKRHFIGNTSMDAGLSFIMANHARVKPNDVVFDPFVGTGGLLVSSAHFGAYVCGTEIDYNTVHGLGKATRMNQKWRGPDENIRANLRQYGLEKYYLDVLVSDASKPVWRKAPLFDAIITDPPYGIRESTRKTGTQKEIIKTELFPESHVPVQLNYHLSDIFSDLFAFASEFLVTGGRLVYWLPVYRPEYTEEVLPRHPCLKLISNCEQMLSSHTSRRLITMEKVKEFEEKYQYAHLGEGQNLPYKGHNSFREKYFSGLKKRTAREERARSEMANAENVKSKGKEDV